MPEISVERSATPRIVGRYALFSEIAAGGMATVHLGRLLGQVGFSRTVAVKRLHPQYAKDEEFTSMFVDEARLASRIQHPNVVSTLDVVKTTEELFLVMEYVPGEALSKLVRNAAKRGERIPPNVVLGVMSGMLHGLHAAHEAKSETREPLNIVHRDISPQNVLVGIDGGARVLDFGVAKAALRSGATKDGQMKGKLSYMSPEQLNGKDIDRRSDIFACGVVLWEALAGKRLFSGADAGEILTKVLTSDIPSPGTVVPGLPDAVSDAVMKALERDPDARFQTAREFAIALEQAAPLATSHSVGEWVREYGGEELAKRAALVAEVEGHRLEELEELSSGVAAVRRDDREDHEPSSGDRTSGVAPPIDTDVQQEGKAKRLWVTFALIALGAAGGAVIGMDLSEPGVVPAAPVAPASEQTAVVQEVRPEVTAELPQIEPEVPAPPPPTAVHQPPALPPTRGPGPVGGTLPTAKPPQPAPNCNPPFYFTQDGIKKPKPQCL
jgi:serine/threonine-protein kinase